MQRRKTSVWTPDTDPPVHPTKARESTTGKTDKEFEIEGITAMTNLFVCEKGDPRDSLERAKTAYPAIESLYELGIFGNNIPSDGDKLLMFPTPDDLSKQMKWRDLKEIENPYDKTTRDQ